MKPKVLYHASANTNVTLLEPKAESFRDKNEGPVVFATPHKDYASCFIVRTDDSWTQISRWEIDTPWNIIVNDKDRFMDLDKGGAIYELPTDSFYCDKTKGTKESEWVSKVAVKPINRIIYKSGLGAMLENGVKVFFVSKDVFKKIADSKDHGYTIVKKLQPYH